MRIFKAKYNKPELSPLGEMIKNIMESGVYDRDMDYMITVGGKKELRVTKKEDIKFD